MTFFCCCTTIPVTQSYWKDFIPLISPIVVVLLFAIDRVLGFRLRKKEIERNWYLKVLIEPGILKISDFYKNTTEYYALSANLLHGSSAIPHNDYLSLKSKEIGKFQSLKRELEAEVIFPIQMRYPAVGANLTASLLNLEDIFATSIDNQLFSEENIKTFQSLVATNRAILLTHLYSPLQSRLFLSAGKF